MYYYSVGGYSDAEESENDGFRSTQEPSVDEEPFCQYCNRSFVHHRALLQHSSVKGHVWCTRCEKLLFDGTAWQEHVEKSHFPCAECNCEFDSEDNRRQHMWTHRSRSMECWTCYSKFKSPAGIFLHLEAGTCSGDVNNRRIIRNIVKCRGPWRSYGVAGRPICFYSCDQDFSRVSAFLQHIENSSCNEGYFSGRQSVWGLLRQLRRNLQLSPVEVYGRIV